MAITAVTEAQNPASTARPLQMMPSAKTTNLWVEGARQIPRTMKLQNRGKEHFQDQ